MWLFCDGKSGFSHYLEDLDAPLLGCGAKNPRVAFSIQGSEHIDHKPASGGGIALRYEELCTPLTEFHIPGKTCNACIPCFQRAYDKICLHRAKALKIEAGKSEVTPDTLAFVRDIESDEEYYCCFSDNAPFSEEVSHCRPGSPMYKALIGSFTQEEVSVRTPGGIVNLAIISVHSCPASSAPRGQPEGSPHTG